MKDLMQFLRHFRWEAPWHTLKAPQDALDLVYLKVPWNLNAHIPLKGRTKFQNIDSKYVTFFTFYVIKTEYEQKRKC